MVAPQQTYAARLEIDYPDRLDRVTTLFRVVLIIPIAIVLSLVSASATSTTVIYQSGEVVEKTTSTGGGIAGGLFAATVLMIVIRQRYPRWWFDFVLQFNRFGTRVGAYLALLTDRYPSTEDEQIRPPRPGLPRRTRGPQPVATAGQVAPGSAPLRRAAVPRGRRRRGSGDRMVRDLVHRSLPARTVRLRRRGRPVGAARAGVRIPPPHRLLPTLQPPLIRASGPLSSLTSGHAELVSFRISASLPRTAAAWRSRSSSDGRWWRLGRPVRPPWR